MMFLFCSKAEDPYSIICEFYSTVALFVYLFQIPTNFES